MNKRFGLGLGIHALEIFGLSQGLVQFLYDMTSNMCGLVWFGSVLGIQTTNRTKPRGSVQKSSVRFRTKCGFCGFRFGLVRFAVILLDWFGFEQP